MKPGFFLNETLASLSPLHRLCFAGLWCLADKAGRLEDRPRRIKAELFPYDTDADTEAMITDLVSAGFLVRYAINETKVLQIKNFAKHQRPHKDEPISKLPECVDSTLPPVDSTKRPAKIVRELVRGLVRRTGTCTEDGDGACPEKPPDPATAFLAWFQIEYKTRRNGAVYMVQWPKDMPTVKRLLKIYDSERLKRHAKILLTTSDDWIDSTDRGIGILSSKINWLEERLATWEKTHEKASTAR